MRCGEDCNKPIWRRSCIDEEPRDTGMETRMRIPIVLIKAIYQVWVDTKNEVSAEESLSYTTSAGNKVTTIPVINDSKFTSVDFGYSDD